MSRFNDSKLVGSSKRLLALFLSVLSLGGTVAYGRRPNSNKRPNRSNNTGNQNMVPQFEIGMTIDNPGYVNLCNRIGNLEEINKEELVRIFEDEFWNIINRDGRNITRFGVWDGFKGILINSIQEYRQIIPQHGTHIINLLWSGGLFILLNEGRDGIENMKADFRNWNRNNISVNELHNYFVQKI